VICIDRPALMRLLADIAVVYKIDRLTRSLTDFSHMIEVFERHGVSFVSVTQQSRRGDFQGRDHPGRQGAGGETH
jgi:site-specific DNA recombinase